MKVRNYVASVSGGKDSIAMFEGILERGLPLDTVIFFNNGMEFPCILRNMQKVRAKCLKRGIEYIELTPPEPFLYSMLEKPIEGRKNGFHYGKGWCGGTCRWGTTQKTSAIHKICKWGWIKEYVGIALDEPERVAKKRRGVKLFPLVDWGMTEKDCLEYCRSKGYSWREGEYDLYDFLNRVSCWCCSNKNLKELKGYYYFLPEYWEKLKDLESRIGKPMKKRHTLVELEGRFQREGKPQVRKRYPHHK